MVYVGMLMLKWMRTNDVDSFISFLAKFYYGDLHKYGIRRPQMGPFLLKETSGRTPVIDGGSIKRIRSKKIKVN